MIASNTYKHESSALMSPLPSVHCNPEVAPQIAKKQHRKHAHTSSCPTGRARRCLVRKGEDADGRWGAGAEQQAPSRDNSPTTTTTDSTTTHHQPHQEEAAAEE